MGRIRRILDPRLKLQGLGIDHRGDQVDPGERRNDEEVPGHFRVDQVQRDPLLAQNVQERSGQAQRRERGLEQRAGDVRGIAEHAPIGQLGGNDEKRREKEQPVDSTPEVDPDRFGDGDVDAVQQDGACWLSGTTWQGKAAMRISFSNWSTTDEDVDRSAAAILASLDETMKTPNC